MSTARSYYPDDAKVAGLISAIVDYDGLPAHIRAEAGHVYVNEDVTGDMPERETLAQTAARLQTLAEQTILAHGGWIEEKTADRVYRLPRP